MNRINSYLPPLAGVILALFAARTHGTEPNETFATATVLAPGVMTVADELTASPQMFPDTLLGARDSFGAVYLVDDDSSELGNGTASELDSVPTNSGGISFSVTGYTDLNFEGSHDEAGQYKVFVDVYDLFGDLVDEISEVRTLAPGVVHNYMYSEFEWLNGEYDVYIDNTISAGPADIDFFTFTGLAPGALFSARTADPNFSNIDTLLGWFDSGGSLSQVDDDDGGDMLSLIEGTVPGDGMLTFAVTGFGDDGFAGFHSESGTYELRLQLGLPGDYNDNNVVDAADYIVWRNTLNQSGANLPADGDNDGTVDNDDYDVWRGHFGQAAPASSSSAPGSAGGSTSLVPEPATYLLALLCAVCVPFRSR